MWGDSEIINWINRGQQYIVKRSWCLGSREAIQVTDGTADYSPVSSLVGVAAVLFYGSGVNRVALRKGDPTMHGHVHDVGQPTHYYWWTNSNDLTVTIFPETIPAGTFYVDVLGIKQPTIVTGGSELIEVPVIYEQALVNYTTAMALFKDNEEQIALNLLTKVDEEVDIYRMDGEGRETTGSTKDS